MKILWGIICVFTIILSHTTHGKGKTPDNNTPRVWIVTSFGNKAITNYDVYNYIDAMILSEMEIIALHKLSQNYEDFSNKLNSIRKEKYDEGLKRLLKIRMLERAAISRDKRKNYFKISQSDYVSGVNNLESTMLKEYLDKKMGIVRAREEYAKYLLAQGVHKKHQNESLGDIYWRFFEREKLRLLESLRESEAQKFEIGEAYRLSSKLPLKLFAHDKFQNATKALIETQLNHKFTTTQKINELTSKNPDIGILLNHLKIYSLERTPLDKIKNEAPLYFEKILLTMREFFTKEIHDNQILRNEKAQRSLEIAQAFSNNYTEEQLKMRLQESLDLFVNGSDYNLLVLAKLYDLALKIKNIELKARTKIFKYALEVNEKARLHTHQHLIQSDLTDLHTGLVFEDIYFNALQEYSDDLIQKLDLDIQNKDYIKYTTSVINWNSKFEAMKMAKNYKEVYVIASVKDPFSHEMFDIIKNYLTAKYLKEQIDKRRPEIIRDESYYVDVNPHGNGLYSPGMLVQFLLQ